jgi:ketosteroid isomerase-like protein
MSQADVEFARRALESVSRHRLARLAEFFDPSVVWETDPAAPEPGTYMGVEAVSIYLEGLSQAFGDLEFEIHDVIETEHGVLGTTTAHGRGGLSGVNVALPWWFLVTIDDGRITRVRSFLEEESALEAAGLLE